MDAMEVDLSGSDLDNVSSVDRPLESSTVFKLGTVPARYPGYSASTVINGDNTRLHCQFVCACACACQIKNLITYNP